MSAVRPATGGPTITLHMVCSLDGFIARADNSVAWLEGYEDVYESGAEHGGAEAAAAFNAIDCFVMGAKTYEHALEIGWPYGDTPVVVVTHRELRRERESVELYSGDLRALVAERLAPRFGNVWLVGGARLCREFLRLDLVDAITLMHAPITLGGGVRLFGDEGDDERRWRLTNAKPYRDGFVELSYTRAAPA